MLDGAKIRQIKIRTNVDPTTVTKLLAIGNAIASRRLDSPETGLAAWFIFIASGQHFCGAELVERVSERAHRVLISRKAYVAALGHIGEILDDAAKISVRMPP